MRKDKLSPLIAQNFEMVQAIKEDIDEAFAQIIQRLNTEKDVLMRALNEIKDDKYSSSHPMPSDMNNIHIFAQMC